MNTAITNDLNKQAEDVKQKVAGLQNVSRLIGNTLSIIGETEVKGAYAKAVAEIQDWLGGFDAQVKAQTQALTDILPKTYEATKEVLKVGAPVLAEVVEHTSEVK